MVSSGCSCDNCLVGCFERSASKIRLASSFASRSSIMRRSSPVERQAREVRRSLLEERRHTLLEVATTEAVEHQALRLVLRLAQAGVQVVVDLALHDRDAGRRARSCEVLDVLPAEAQQLVGWNQVVGEAEAMRLLAVDAP